MGSELAKLFVTIGADITGFNKGIKSVQSQMKIAGAAMTAMGAAGLKLVDSAREINAQLATTAITLGTTTGEMRNMVMETANVTFGIDSVTKTFDILAKAGIRNQEEMKKSATAFDTLGDATFSSAETVADLLIPAFKNLGVQLPQTADDLDMFTWLTKNTTVELTEFATAMQYVAAYGENLNMTIDDMVAIMAALEAKGITGSAVTRVFRTAVSQAADGTVTLNEALGLSQEEIDGYKTELESATGITQQYADAANTQYGIMDKLRFMWSKITLQIGSFLTPLEPVLAAMTAMGPVMLFLSSSMGRSALAFISNAAATMKSHIATSLHIGSSANLAGAQTAVAGATATATRAFMGLRGAMMAIPITAIAVGIYFLVQYLRKLYYNWEVESIKIEQTWLDMRDKVLNAARDIIDVWGVMASKIPGLENIMLRVSGAISDMINVNKIQADALAAERAWYDLQDAVKDNVDQIIADAEMATERRISEAEMAASQEITEIERVRDEEKGILEERAQFYRDLTEDRLRQIDEQMIAELAAMDTDVGKAAQAYKELMDDLEAEDKKREEDKTNQRYKDLEKELNSGKELTKARKLQIKDEMAEIEAGWELEREGKKLWNDIMALDKDKFFEDEIAEADRTAQTQIDIVNGQLAETIGNYETELEAFKDMNADKLTDLREYVAEYNRILSEAGMRGTVSGLEVPEGPLPAARERPSNPLEFFQWAANMVGYSSGGWINEPSLLYGLNSRKFYGTVAETEPELVTPAAQVAGGGSITNNFPGPYYIREEADIYKLAREFHILQSRTDRRVGN